MSITGGDAEVLQVLAVVDQAEIADGRLAQQRARNAQVKAYARQLVTSHQRSLQKDRQLAKSQNVQLMPTDSTAKAATGTDTNRSPAGATGASTPMGTPSAVAMQLHTMHTQTMEQVRSQQGAAFDSAFVNAQVMGHQQVLDLLQRAQGQPQNADVQQHLSAAVKEVQTHLDRARELQQSLASGTGTASDTTSKARSDTTSKAKSDTGRRPG